MVALAPTEAADPADAPSARKQSAATVTEAAPTPPTPTLKVKLALKREGSAADTAATTTTPPPLLRIKVSAGPGEGASSSDKGARKHSAPDAAGASTPASSERKIKLLPLKAEVPATDAPPVVVAALARHVLDALAKLRDGYVRELPHRRPACALLMKGGRRWRSDRVVTALFQTLPRRSELPDYYALVEHPISLKEITVWQSALREWGEGEALVAV